MKGVGKRAQQGCILHALPRASWVTRSAPPLQAAGAAPTADRTRSTSALRHAMHRRAGSVGRSWDSRGLLVPVSISGGIWRAASAMAAGLVPSAFAQAETRPAVMPPHWVRSPDAASGWGVLLPCCMRTGAVGSRKKRCVEEWGRPQCAVRPYLAPLQAPRDAAGIACRNLRNATAAAT